MQVRWHMLPEVQAGALLVGGALAWPTAALADNARYGATASYC